MKRKIILSAILTIALCMSLITGATFALFTSESKVNIAINSGKVEMVANISDIETWSLEDNKEAAGRTDGTFTLGGKVSFENSLLTIDKIVRLKIWQIEKFVLSLLSEIKIEKYGQGTQIRREVL